MKITPLTIRHAVCAGCGYRKFVFMGKSDFCRECIIEHCELVMMANDVPNRELIAGALSDMHDCFAGEGTDATAHSEAFKVALSRRDKLEALMQEQHRADCAAYDAAMIVYEANLKAQKASGVTAEVAKEVAQRAASQAYDTKYKEEFSQERDLHA